NKEMKSIPELTEEERNQPMSVAMHDRAMAFLKMQNSLKLYRSTLEEAKVANKKVRKAKEGLCQELAKECEDDIKRMIALDNEVGRLAAADGQLKEKKKVDNGFFNKNADNAFNVMVGTKVPALPSYGKSGAVGISKFFGIGDRWFENNSTLNSISLWSGTVANSFDALNQFGAAIFTAATLWKTHESMSAEDVTEKVLSIAGNATSITKDALMTYDLFETAGDVLAKQTAKVQIVAGVATAVSTGIAIANTVSFAKQKKYGKKATDYFDKKHKKKLDAVKSKEELREEKYEKNIMKLQNDLAKRSGYKMGIAWGNAAIAATTIFIPGVGAIAGLGFAIFNSVMDSKIVSGIKTRLFDGFYNMDEILKKVKGSKEAQRTWNLPAGTEAEGADFKAAVRRRVAAQAGFSDMAAAANHLCGKFARFIRKKLFEENLPAEEKQGYIDMVKSLNLSYNEKKQYPKESAIFRKLTAS
nr:hypothetical protein [Lachnospiraceae bacterium]